MNLVGAFTKVLGDDIADVVHHISIVARAADQGVGTRATVQGVVAVKANKRVGRAIADEHVVQRIARAIDRARAGQGQVLDVGRERVTYAGFNQISPFTRILDDHIADVVHQISIIAQAANQHIGVGAAVQRVVAVQTDDLVHPGGAHQRIGQWRTNDRIDHRGQIEHIGGRQAAVVGYRDLDRQHAGIEPAGRAKQGARRGVEAQPGRQRRAIGERGRIAQGIACIRIAEGVDRNNKIEGNAGSGRLIDQRIGDDRSVIDVDDGRRGRTRHLLHRAMSIDVTGVDPDLHPYLRLGERQRGRRGAADVAPRCAIRRALPLIADRTQSINVGQRVAGGKYFVLRRDAGDRNAAGWRVIDVGDGRGR